MTFKCFLYGIILLQSLFLTIIIKSSFDISCRCNKNKKAVKPEKIRKYKKPPIVSLPYAITNPRAVMIHYLNAAIANRTMHSSWWSVY